MTDFEPRPFAVLADYRKTHPPPPVPVPEHVVSALRAECVSMRPPIERWRLLRVLTATHICIVFPTAAAWPRVAIVGSDLLDNQAGITDLRLGGIETINRRQVSILSAIGRRIEAWHFDLSDLRRAVWMLEAAAEVEDKSYRPPAADQLW